MNDIGFKRKCFNETITNRKRLQHSLLSTQSWLSIGRKEVFLLMNKLEHSEQVKQDSLGVHFKH